MVKLRDPRGNGAAPRQLSGSVGNGAGTDDGYDDEYGEEYEDVTITISSLKKARKFQILGIVSIVLAMCGFAAWFLLGQQMTANNMTYCYSYEVAVEKLAQNYMTVNGFSSLPAYVEDIPNFGSVSAKCPNGGAYTWNPVTGTYSCSYHGHHPDDFATPQSQTLSTNTEAVPEDES